VQGPLLFCIFVLPFRYGDVENYLKFKGLSEVYKRLYDPTTGFFTGLTSKGDRKHDRSPFHASNDGLWTEGTCQKDAALLGQHFSGVSIPQW
jgi:putative alpha-1,2-mannosidase